MNRIMLLRAIRRTTAPRRLSISIAIASLTLGTWLLPAPLAHADIIIVVDTAADVIANDNLCSLREAITAANNNGNYSNCIGTGGGYDLIEFGIGAGTPVINIDSALPTITGPVEINGGPNRVELLGNGTGSGLTISGAGANGSIVRGLVLNGFSTGIKLVSANNIVVAGNFIGTNAAGTTRLNRGAFGIWLENSTARIGGTNGLTAGGPCTGDCNLISGHTEVVNGAGVRITMNSAATIHGNFIGTNASGTAALGNNHGVRVEDPVFNQVSPPSSVTIGGTAAGAGNLISGNLTGISILIAQEASPGTVIQGNRIGTNVSGSGAIPNGNGIDVNLDNEASYAVSIGGSTAAAGNLISGNTEAGIRLTEADYVIIFGNRIGTQANGTSPLPNGAAGVQLSSSTHDNVIGGIGSGEGNIIAHNEQGVTISQNNYHNRVRGNSIKNNTGKGISLTDSQNDTTSTPVITGVGPVSGTACANCMVDIYSDAADEGGTYQGSVMANGAGNWSFIGAVSGPNVTATATSAVGSTSEFSAPVLAVPECIMKSGFENGSSTCT